MGRNRKKMSENKQNLKESSHSENTSSNEQGDSDNESELENNEYTDIKSMKRPHGSDESDNAHEEKSKKPKKKKKMPITEESTSKKNKKSIRQMKREKHAERVALEQASAKDQTKSQCLSYLSLWKHDRQNWKFMKAKQVWLHKNKFSIHLVPDDSWPLLLEYFESAKGNIKTLLLNDADKIIKQMDEWTESQMNKDVEIENEQSESTNIVKPDETVYKRARSLIQCLQE